jgi:hypothetical protein
MFRCERGVDAPGFQSLERRVPTAMIRDRPPAAPSAAPPPRPPPGPSPHKWCAAHLNDHLRIRGEARAVSADVCRARRFVCIKC